MTGYKQGWRQREENAKNRTSRYAVSDEVRRQRMDHLKAQEEQQAASRLAEQAERDAPARDAAAWLIEHVGAEGVERLVAVLKTIPARSILDAVALHQTACPAKARRRAA